MLSDVQRVVSVMHGAVGVGVTLNCVRDERWGLLWYTAMVFMHLGECDFVPDVLLRRCCDRLWEGAITREAGTSYQNERGRGHKNCG